MLRSIKWVVCNSVLFRFIRWAVCFQQINHLMCFCLVFLWLLSVGFPLLNLKWLGNLGFLCLVFFHFKISFRLLAIDSYMWLLPVVCPMVRSGRQRQGQFYFFIDYILSCLLFHFSCLLQSFNYYLSWLDHAGYEAPNLRCGLFSFMFSAANCCFCIILTG